MNEGIKKIINLGNYVEIQEKIQTKTIMTCYVRLDKKSMLEALNHEIIYINGKYYKVPEIKLLECLINKRFGQIKLNLEEL
jgi:hypothetical protein